VRRVNQPANRSGGRVGSGGNSAGARGAILLVVAAVLGIVLLQAFDTSGGSGVVNVGGTTVPLGNGSSGTGTVGSTEPGPTNTVPVTRAPSLVTVLVANGTGIRGLGSQNADALKALGYNTLTAVDATKNLDASIVQYVPGYQPEATAIALTLGLQPASVQALNAPPVPDTQSANVVVVLGADVARTASSSTTTTI
jgi:hypothetical protein